MARGLVDDHLFSVSAKEKVITIVLLHKSSLSGQTHHQRVEGITSGTQHYPLEAQKVQIKGVWVRLVKPVIK